MHVSLTTFQISPEKIDEFMEEVRLNGRPVLSQLKGLQRALTLADRAAGKIVAVGIWDTEADAMASRNNPNITEEVGRLSKLAAGPPVRELFEASIEV